MRTVPIKEVARIETGTTPSTKKPEYYGGGIPFVKPADLSYAPRIVQESDNYVTQLGFEQGRKIPKGGVMVCSIGATIGKVGLAGKDLITNQQINTAIFDEAKVLPKFGLYFFGSLGDKLADKSSSTTVPIINKTNFSKLEIPLPSLSEQKAIVAKLDRAQRLIDIDKEMLAKYDELIQSVFLEMFGDVESEKVSLSELVKLNPRKSEISDIDKSIEASFLGMADVGENGSLNLSEIQTIEESWKGYTYFKEDDVLFAKITPCMENGKGAIAKGLRNGLGFGSTEFHVLRPIEGVSRSAWIYHLTHSDKFRKIAESFMTGSAGQKRVPTHFFDRFRVVKPSIEKQMRFEEIASEISEDKKRLRSQIKKSEELFSALVQKTFNKK